MKYSIFSFAIFFLLLFCILRYGSRNRDKPKTIPIYYKYKIDSVDRYHVDSTGKYLLRYNGDTVK